MGDKRNSVNNINRRQFLATTAKAGCVMGLAGLGISALAKSQSLAPQAIRPLAPSSRTPFSRPVFAVASVSRLVPMTL